MLSEFFINDIGCTLIKNIIDTVPLPVYDTVTDGDKCINGLTYIYKTYVIRCTKSGILDGENLGLQSLSFGKAIDDGRAKFRYADVVDQDYRFHIGRYTPNLTKYYKCNTSHYDRQTHEYLGDYLRMIRDVKGMDLMHLYNCFNYNMVSNLSFEKIGKHRYQIESKTNKDYKVIAIPIKFNKTYTIAIDSQQQLLVGPTLYSHVGILQDVVDRFKDQFNVKEINFSRFLKPFTFSVDTNDIDLIRYQKNLYLILQISKTNKSSIVVLEGDYTDVDSLKQFDIEMTSESKLNKLLLTDLELLMINDGKFYSYNKKLIPYLLNNVISSDEVIPQNIKRIQDIIVNEQDDIAYKEYHLKNDVWSDNLRYQIFKNITQKKVNQQLIKDAHGRKVGISFDIEYDSKLRDQNGFVDQPAEHILYGGK